MATLKRSAGTCHTRSGVNRTPILFIWQGKKHLHPRSTTIRLVSYSPQRIVNLTHTRIIPGCAHTIKGGRNVEQSGPDAQKLTVQRYLAYLLRCTHRPNTPF